MAWCLIKSEEAKFRKALIDREIDPFKLAEPGMTSEKRRALFEKYVDPENAFQLNALFESKLLLKNQIKGFENWAKRALGMTPERRSDLFSKIQKLQEQGVLDPKQLEDFKADLAKSRLGIGLTFEEAKHINTMSKEIESSKEAWKQELQANPEWSTNPQETRKQWFNNSKRLEYGLKQTLLEKYVNDLKLDARKQNVNFKENPIRFLLNPVKSAPVFFNDLAKSLMASIDNSFFGRQGIKNLYGSPSQKRIWVNNFLKSFKDIGAVLVNRNPNVEVMDLIRADIYSRPNALNGKYRVGKYGLDVLTEEAFPTSLPEKIPALGRLFKASETAFNGAALRMRADLADMYITKMEKSGLNALNPDHALGIGNLVGSLTGRGNLGRFNAVGKELNFVFWSAKFFKSNIDTLTAHQFDSKATEFTKVEARKNLVSIAAHVGLIMLVSKILNPDSVDEDPRSTNFGKIKINGVWIDITGGLGSVATMAARLLPSYHNGELGIWKKSSSGNWSNLQEKGFGKEDAVDVLVNAVFLNKLAPFASVVRDYLRGEMFGGEPFNIQESIVNSGIPLSIQQVEQVKDKGYATILGVIASEFLGLGTSSYEYQSNWSSSTSKEMKEFRKQVGESKFKDANTSYNRVYNIWYEEVQKDKRFKELSDEQKEKLINDARSAIKEKILKEYGYKKPKEKKTATEKSNEKKLKKLIP